MYPREFFFETLNFCIFSLIFFYLPKQIFGHFCEFYLYFGYYKIIKLAQLWKGDCFERKAFIMPDPIKAFTAKKGKLKPLPNKLIFHPNPHEAWKTIKHSKFSKVHKTKLSYISISVNLFLSYMKIKNREWMNYKLFRRNWKESLNVWSPLNQKTNRNYWRKYNIFCMEMRFERHLLVWNCLMLNIEILENPMAWKAQTVQWEFTL